MRALVVGLVVSSTMAACGTRREQQVPPEPPAPVISAPVIPAIPAQARPPSDLGWVESLQRAKGFTTYDLHAEQAPLFHWRLLRQRRLPDAPKGEEYPGLYVRAITLTVGSRTIALGDHSGWPESATLTRCRALGYRQPAGEAWSFPDLPSVIASFSVATMQGSADWLILDGGNGRLHVLGRHTHDGSCPVEVEQGPLEVCADMKWERRFDLVVGDHPPTLERITVFEEGRDGDFDCTQSYSGSRLIPPSPPAP